MGELQQKMPPGYEVHISYDATEYIREELNKIYFRTGLTVLILLVFVWIITLNLKYLLLIVTSLAINIALQLFSTICSVWRCNCIHWQGLLCLESCDRQYYRYDRPYLAPA